MLAKSRERQELSSDIDEYRRPLREISIFKQNFEGLKEVERAIIKCTDNLQKLKEFENWRGNFNDHIITMMGLQRWKAYALEQDPEVSMAGGSEGDFNYIGMGVNDAIEEAGNTTRNKATAVASTYE